MSENLVSGLSSEIERVSNKAQRWRGYMDDMGPQGAVGMGITLKIMEAELDTARSALRSGDILLMMPAYQALKEYSDDD